MLKQLETSGGFGFPVILSCSCFSFFHFMRESALAHTLRCGGKVRPSFLHHVGYEDQTWCQGTLLPQASFSALYF